MYLFTLKCILKKKNERKIAFPSQKFSYNVWMRLPICKIRCPMDFCIEIKLNHRKMLIIDVYVRIAPIQAHHLICSRKTSFIILQTPLIVIYFCKYYSLICLIECSLEFITLFSLNLPYFCHSSRFVGSKK